MILKENTIPGVSQGGRSSPALLDPHGRHIDYMRLSITDRCNERCLYCMPEGFKGWQRRADILTDDEILAVARAFAAEGVTKFRVTGGEPLLRSGVPALIRALYAIPGVAEVGLSTNGLLLGPLVNEFVDAGLRSVNVSLDALSPETYARVTGGRLAPVIDSMRLARDAGIRVKVNCVLMRGVNEDEILPLVERAAAEGWLLRFVELMPLSRTDVLNESNFLAAGVVIKRLRERFTLTHDDTKRGNGPASYWRVKELNDMPLGFIGSITTEHFCAACNKVRLTADGKLRPCLGRHDEHDLMPALRPEISDSHLRDIFRRVVGLKPRDHEFNSNYQPGRHMTAIGG
jgi:cyclic pyranopterin phosphate synthase